MAGNKTWIIGCQETRLFIMLSKNLFHKENKYIFSIKRT
jgi:hypothetical protein